MALPVIDIHTHLAGLGHGGTQCFISPRKFRSPLYKLMRWKLGVYRADREGRLDQAYLERLDKDVRLAAEHRALDAAVVFAHERIYTEEGQVHPSRQELYVPNEYAFACCERPEMRGRLMPAMSIHPYRADAIDESLRWIERGAVAMKWLPNSQNMNPADKRCLKIYDLLAERRVPLIAHTGGEHTVSIMRPELGNPELLRPALDRGVTVIVAHCGTKSGLFDTNWMPHFCKLAREYPNCWGDTSTFCTPGRTRWISRILREEGVVEKLIHGSDYPVPPAAWTALFSLGLKRTRSLHQIWSFLERDVRIKRELGMPEMVFTNAARVLAPGSLERWGVKILTESCTPFA
jgi:uncharacterized protein